MTNSKARNTETVPTAKKQQLQQERNVLAGAARHFDEPLSRSPEAADINVPDLETEDNDDGEEDDDDNDDDEEEEEDELDSCSSFSLEECINEFRARRVRRLSTHSREREVPLEDGVAAKHIADQDEVDLIQQNRSNKEQERKCKPCRNGFCYCFTSDSGDGGRCGGGDALAARGAHVRQHRRNRKSESSQFNQVMPQQQQNNTADEQRRQSAPANLKTIPKVQITDNRQTPMHKGEGKAKPKSTFEVNETSNGLTAYSRLETTSGDNAPLIHIIQELRNNCVISEVRVNRNKIQAQQLSRSRQIRPDATSTTTTATATTTTNSSPRKPVQREALESHKPTAPPLEMPPLPLKDHAPSAPAFAYCPPFNDSAKSSETSARRERTAGGRLLQKRLSQQHVTKVTRRSVQPPPKPPRSYHNLGEIEKSSISSLASTSPSVREAERVIDEFLRRRGVRIPGGQKPKENRKQSSRKIDRSVQTDYDELCKMNELYKRDKRKSCPLSKWSDMLK